MSQTDSHLVNANGVAERLRAELEQAHVAIEDMSERVSELVRANEELVAELKKESRLRALTEIQLQELREQAQPNRSAQVDCATLRQELSVALEELQVMQEELQAAHEVLSGARPAPR